MRQTIKCTSGLLVETPLAIDLSSRVLPALVRYLSGSLKLWMPTCWIGTCAPWIASCAASIMSGNVPRYAGVTRNFGS